MQLFISYSRVDRDFTDRFVARIRRMFPSNSVWYDEELHGGDNWWNEILNQIAACDIFIYLLSNESVISDYCKAEFAEAQRLQKRIITVQVRDRTKLPPELGDIQYVDMKRGVDDADAITNIARALSYQQEKLPKRPLKPLGPFRTARPSIQVDLQHSSSEDIDTPTLSPLVNNERPVDLSHRPTNRGKVVGIVGIIAMAVVTLISVVPNLSGNALTSQTATAIALEITSNTQNVLASQTNTFTSTVTNTHTQLSSTQTPTSTFTPTVTPSRTPTLVPTSTPTFGPIKSLTNLKTEAITLNNTFSIQPVGQLYVGKPIKDGRIQIVWSPNGRRFAVAITHVGIMIFNTYDLSKPQVLQQYNDVTSIAFSPDGKYLASGSWDTTIRIWDLATDKLVKAIDSGGSELAYSPDGQFIVSSASDFKLRKWNSITGELLQTLNAHSTYINGVAYSPDGRFFISGSGDRLVKLWDAASGENLLRLNGDIYCVMTVAYSPNGHSFLDSGCDGRIKMWDASNGNRLFSTITYTDVVWSVSYSPDSLLLLSGAADKMVTLWNASTGTKLATLPGHLDEVKTVAFSPDGHFIASGSIDGTIILWGVTSN